MSAAPALHAHVSLREGPLRERIHHAYRGVHGWQKLVVKLEHHLLEDLAVSAVVSSTRPGEERAAVALQLGIYDAEVRAVALAVIHLVVFARMFFRHNEYVEILPMQRREHVQAVAQRMRGVFEITRYLRELVLRVIVRLRVRPAIATLAPVAAATFAHRQACRPMESAKTKSADQWSQRKQSLNGVSHIRNPIEGREHSTALRNTLEPEWLRMYIYMYIYIYIYIY